METAESLRTARRWRQMYLSKLQSTVQAVNTAGVAVEPSGQMLKEICSRLARNVATLPTSASVRVTADRLPDAPEIQSRMKEWLGVVVAVAREQSIPLDMAERWEATFVSAG